MGYWTGSGLRQAKRTQPLRISWSEPFAYLGRGVLLELYSLESFAGSVATVEKNDRAAAVDRGREWKLSYSCSLHKLRMSNIIISLSSDIARKVPSYERKTAKLR